MPATERLTPDDAGIARAAALLAAGQLVAFPTETVYGLGADAADDTAVARIFEAKGRPRFNPLIAHVADTAAARRIGHLDARAEQLAAAFWPGPLTLVVPLRADAAIAPLVTAGLATIALRVPAGAVAQALLRAHGGALAAPSANPSGRVSPTRAAHVLDGLDGRIAAVLEGGPCTVGVESTIVGLTDAEPTLLRPGGVPRAAIEHCLGTPVAAPDAASAVPTAPGQLASHYAPRVRMRLDARDAAADEILIGFGACGEDAAFNLSPAGDLTEAAANLFHVLRAADARAAPGTRIAVAPIPEAGLGQAINDRLRRAAAPRP